MITSNDLITQAYAKLGIPGESNSLSVTQLSDGLSRLSGVVSLAVTDGMPLWKRTTVTVSPSAISQKYTLTDSIKVADVFIHDVGGSRYSLQEKSLYDFNKLPTNLISIPIHYIYQPSNQGGVVSIWPLTSDATTIAEKQLEIVYQKEFDGMVLQSDVLDFPSYWNLAIIYKLATVLAPEYGVPLLDRNSLKEETKEFWKLASDYGDETGSLFIQPDRNY
jgi:hypothetical protein